MIRVVGALVSYAIYFLLVFSFVMTYANTGHASLFYLIAIPAFGVFAALFIIGLFRWTRKTFPQKKRTRK